MTDENRSRLRSFARRARSAAVRLGVSATAWVGIMSLCGFLAAWAWPFELLCHFRVQYTLLFLTTALLLAVLGRRRWALIAVVLAVINGWELLFYYVGWNADEVGGASPFRLRIVSANLFSGNTTPERAATFLEQCDADVIAAYEVTPAWEARLAAALQDYPYRRIHSAAGNFGIAFYSRLPFESVEFQPLSESDLAIQAEFTKSGERIHLIAAHVYPPGGSRTALRDHQLEELGILAAKVTEPLIVVGDLNMTPFSPSFQRLLKATSLEEARRGNGILPTWPAGRPWAIPIDHALVSAHWVRSVTTGPDIGSDHLPLIVELDLKSEEGQ